MTAPKKKSSPLIRQQIMEALRRLGSVSGNSVREIRDALGLAYVSITQFDRALGSLVYKYGAVTWRRFWSDDDPAAQTRAHTVALA